MSEQVIEDIIEYDGIFVSYIRDKGMYPMLRKQKDRMVIREAPGRLSKYDVVLYRYSSENYILQRVIDFDGYGYVMCGDNSSHKIYGVMDMQVVGILTDFYRGEKHISCNSKQYRFYVRFWWFIFPLRKLLKKIKRFYSPPIR